MQLDRSAISAFAAGEQSVRNTSLVKQWCQSAASKVFALKKCSHALSLYTHTQTYTQLRLSFLVCTKKMVCICLLCVCCNWQDNKTWGMHNDSDHAEKCEPSLLWDRCYRTDRVFLLSLLLLPLCQVGISLWAALCQTWRSVWSSWLPPCSCCAAAWYCWLNCSTPSWRARCPALSIKL